MVNQIKNLAHEVFVEKENGAFVQTESRYHEIDGSLKNSDYVLGALKNEYKVAVSYLNGEIVKNFELEEVQDLVSSLEQYKESFGETEDGESYRYNFGLFYVGGVSEMESDNDYYKWQLHIKKDFTNVKIVNPEGNSKEVSLSEALKTIESVKHLELVTGGLLNRPTN